MTFCDFLAAFSSSRSTGDATILMSKLPDLPASFLFFSYFLLRGITSSPVFSAVASEGLSFHVSSAAFFFSIVAMIVLIGLSSESDDECCDS